MPIFGLIFILQILCAVHVIRTGRPYLWIYLIIFVPMLGMAIYFIAELAPEMLGSRSGRKAVGGVAKALNPGRELRDAERRLALTPTAENTANLANAYVGVGRTEEAVALYHEALTGIHAHDPATMQELARTHFIRGEFAEAQAVLEELRAANPGYESAEGHLLYARSLEAQDKIDAAIEEYQALVPTYPGQEARCRYALLLRKANREADARRIFQEICQEESFAPRYARRLQKEWFALARREAAQ